MAFFPPETVFGSFNSIAKNFKVKLSNIVIDNAIFKFHYRFTTLMLLAGSVLVTSRQLIGEHIKCINEVKSVPEQVMNQYCFIKATYTVVRYNNNSYLENGEIPHLGVGPIADVTKENIVRHAYYQWVPFVLFGQALMFYLPHLIWKKLEGGRLRHMVAGTEMHALAFSEKPVTYETAGKKIVVPTLTERENYLKSMKTAFLDRLYINNRWAISLICCEILNLLNLILQVYLTNLFLGGHFWELGFEVMEKGLEGDADILNVVFPKVTKCIFHKYGASGSIQAHDALCIMALNVINEKIYIVLWFWYIILAGFTLLGIIWRLLAVILHSRSKLFNKLAYGFVCPGDLNPWHYLSVTKHNNFPDWLFLYYLATNIDGRLFKELIQEIAKDLDQSKTAAIANKEPKNRQNRQKRDSEEGILLDLSP